MGIWDESSDSSKERERFNLEMSGIRSNIWFVKRNVRIVFLVDIEVFHEAFPKEVVECQLALLELLTRLP